MMRKIPLTVLVLLAVAAAVISHGVLGRRVEAIALFAGVFLVLLLGYYWSVKWLVGRHHADEFVQRYEAVRATIETWSAAEARRVADRVLENGSLFSVVRHGSEELPGEIGPLQRELFGRYSTIRALKTGLTLDAAGISPSVMRPEFIRIGSDTECELISRAGQDEIFEVDAMDRQGETLRSYPTPYHLLVIAAWVMMPGSIGEL